MGRFGMLVFSGLNVNAKESRSERQLWLDALARDLAELREAGAGPWDLVVLGPGLTSPGTLVDIDRVIYAVYAIRNVVSAYGRVPDWVFVPGPADTIRPGEASAERFFQAQGRPLFEMDSTGWNPGADTRLVFARPDCAIEVFALPLSWPPESPLISIERLRRLAGASSDSTHRIVFAHDQPALPLLFDRAESFDLGVAFGGKNVRFDRVVSIEGTASNRSSDSTYSALMMDTDLALTHVWPRRFSNRRFTASTADVLDARGAFTISLSGNLSAGDVEPAAPGSLPTALDSPRDTLPPPPTVAAPGIALAHTFPSSDETIRVAWSPTGAHLALKSNDGLVTLLRVADMSVVSRAPPHGARVCDIAWSCDGLTLYSVNEKEFFAHGLESGEALWRHELPGGGDTCVAALPDGRAIVGGAYWIGYASSAHLLIEEPHLRVRCVAVDPASGEPVFGTTSGLYFANDERVWARVCETGAAVRDLHWLGGTRQLVLALDDRSVCIFDVDARRVTRTLEGHRDVVTGISLSPDARLLASKSNDGTVRLWSIATWREVACFDEPTIGSGWFSNVAFSPTAPVLATPGPNNRELRLWEVDVEALVREAPGAPAQITELCAKVVMVGEGGAGKSSLAHRLVHGTYQEMPATHGMQLWRVPHQRLASETAPPGERREVLLWDFGGQSVYRVLHQLFVRDTALALVLVDPRREHPLREARSWSTLLSKQSERGASLRRVLVITKSDEDAPRDDTALARFASDHGFVGPVLTSARTGDGVEGLARILMESVPWDELSARVRPELFQHVRDEVSALRERGRVAVVYREFTSHMRGALGERYDERAVDTVVRQLAEQGLVYDSRMSDGERALVLHVEQVERYAGSIILLAREMPRGLPMVDHGALLVPGAALPQMRGDERLARNEELVVLECVVEQLVRHGVCVKVAGALLFPSLFPREAGEGGALDGYAVSHYYDFRGVDEAVYASLVARLTLSEHFGPLRLLPGRAEYTGTDGGTVGARWTERDPDRQVARVEVFCNATIVSERRDVFVSLVEGHLREHGVDIKPFTSTRCAHCARPFDDGVVHLRLERGDADIGCPACELRTLLPLSAKAICTQNPAIEAELKKIREEETRRRDDAAIEAKVAFTANRKEAPVEPIRILHLSDLHLDARSDPNSVLQPLVQDLRDATDGLGIERLDYLVVSGDLTNRATPEEFAAAHQFLAKLIERFGLAPQRVAIVPGNHDQSWDPSPYEYRPARSVDPKKLAPGSYLEAGAGYLVRDEARYARRFDSFTTHLYHPLLQTPYPLDAARQGVTFLSGDARVQFILLNSSWQIDEHFAQRSSIDAAALASALTEADEALDKERRAGRLGAQARPLRVAVWHHPVTGNDKIADDAFLEQLQKADVRVCLHGHVHAVRADVVGYTHPTRKVHVVGAGSFGAPSKDRPESTPALYNLIELDPSLRRANVHTRGRSKRGGAFTGYAIWPGAEPRSKRSYYELDLGDHGWPVVST